MARREEENDGQNQFARKQLLTRDFDKEENYDISVVEWDIVWRGNTGIAASVAING